MGGLFRAILGVDAGEVETNAYYHVVNFFLPSANFLFDLGGQDMKCIRMRDGASLRSSSTRLVRQAAAASSTTSPAPPAREKLKLSALFTNVFIPFPFSLT
jgi:hypothetical protein